MKIDLTVAGYTIRDNKLLLIYHVKTGLWLPPGGHIEKDETPDEALLREIKQELNLEINILNTSKIPQEGNIIKQLAIPFYCDTHKVIDHIHYCLNYICEPLTDKIIIKKDEIRDYNLFSERDLWDKKIPVNIRNIGLLAFNKYKEIKK
jgi:8-oxo-dGTP pyrophosphatase MutT (NUDIX family)